VAQALAVARRLLEALVTAIILASGRGGPAAGVHLRVTPGFIRIG